MEKIFGEKTLIISGGLGDIGRALALEFARQGAHIGIGDILPENDAAGLLEQIRILEVKAHYRQVDITDPEAVARWVLYVENTLGPPDLIIANAATVTLGGIHDITPAQWARELRVNLDGAFYLAQAATARLLHHGRPGRVVFVGSWAAASVHVHCPSYSVSKAGLRMLCQCMALELAPHQILVNEIAPGYVEAGLSAGIWADNPGLKEVSREKIPIKKIISPQAVAWQAVQLCHPQNEHMTGSTVLMDGGLSLLT
ncbi:SDR family NAD(P)-dependent oxidoreductase [Dyadobacter fermentans]|uniref:Short-chain dehydrogenase/reductase SDR n=1 Tax=Dyadobacter fermentans (strain ATCC 700827 / DSM 18053 / CIP 107007 / KCTC 52180 / NS114) TaxID=471854 RepID=C6VT85_DYAFD|nr:SDR family oxidoreductase [Dyadobacter fermentans]ACT96449.1 short-chain dehydrogenase/reductase SDR [Dyadobacter fermentans DSM 18053]